MQKSVQSSDRSVHNLVNKNNTGSLNANNDNHHIATLFVKVFIECDTISKCSDCEFDYYFREHIHVLSQPIKFCANKRSMILVIFF